MAKSVYIADVCKEIFAGGDVPKDALSYEKTEEYNVPIFSNGEKNYINGHKRICKILQTTSILTISVLTVR